MTLSIIDGELQQFNYSWPLVDEQVPLKLDFIRSTSFMKKEPLCYSMAVSTTQRRSACPLDGDTDYSENLIRSIGSGVERSVSLSSSPWSETSMEFSQFQAVGGDLLGE